MVKSATACLVCDAPAKHAPITAGDYVEIDCPDCGQYQASDTYRKAVRHHSGDIRRRSLERARLRARYGLSPLVTTYDLP